MAEEKESEEMIFPITRDACPCGCKERLGQKIITRLIEKGILSKGLFPDGPMLQIPLVDSKRIQTLLTPTTKIPIITVYWDICKECGTMYCNKLSLDIKDVPVQVQQMPDQGGLGGGHKFSPS